jgi:hypothetical protein
LSRVEPDAGRRRAASLGVRLSSWVPVWVEPEPGAGGAGRVFEACASRLPGLDYSVWRFRPPFDWLFRLCPSFPTEQAVYAYVRDPRVTDALGAHAARA